MGSYKEVKGDLLRMATKGEFNVIVHGANCNKTMGAGIAAGIRTIFPTAYHADYMDTRQPIQRLGDLTYIYEPASNVYVANLYTQYYGGPNLDYTALELSLKKLSFIFNRGKEGNSKLKIGLPMIGCGIAGGDWNIVKQIIQRVLSEYDVTIVIYDK